MNRINMPNQKMQYGKLPVFFKNANDKYNCLLYAIIGAALFLLVYGITPLIVTNDHWILNGYVENDVIQHYTGWMAFRQSDWSIPLGRIDGLGGTTLTYTDSIPWISIIMKLFSPLLPSVFQYFGWYIFLTFILQATVSGMLIKRVTNNIILTYGGVLLFTLSPIMMERAFRHTALASHWLITFSLYLYFSARENRKLSAKFILLAVVSIGIHPYFLPMVFGIMACGWVENSLKKRETILHNSGVLAISLVLTAAAGYLIGALGPSTNLGGDGYGYYSMNLNAPFNPISCGDIKWSAFLPVFPQILGNYDGFNYLGLGVIALIVISTGIFTYKKELLTEIQNNVWLLLLGLCFTLFAISNVMTFHDAILIEYPLPDFLMNFAAIFRASSRMFYPVYYLLILLGLKGLSYLNIKMCSAIMILLAAIQVVDIAPGLITKHMSFDLNHIEQHYRENELNTASWKEIFHKCSGIKLLNGIRNYKLAAFCERNGWKIDMSISSSHFGGADDLSSQYQANNNEIRADSVGKTVYITDDIDLACTLICENDNMNAYRMGNFLALISNDIEISAGELLDVSTEHAPVSPDISEEVVE